MVWMELLHYFAARVMVPCASCARERSRRVQGQRLRRRPLITGTLTSLAVVVVAAGGCLLQVEKLCQHPRLWRMRIVDADISVIIAHLNSSYAYV